MKDRILEISKRLENDTISYQAARLELCKLFKTPYTPHVTGKAIVHPDTDWVYAGLELDIIGVKLEYSNGNGCGVYADGTRDYKLLLVGHYPDRTYTVIHETDLIITELNED